MSAARRVRVSAAEVEAFKAKWPCSGLVAGRHFFQFDGNGNLVDVATPKGAQPTDALAALADDARDGRIGTVLP